MKNKVKTVVMICVMLSLVLAGGCETNEGISLPGTQPADELDRQAAKIIEQGLASSSPQVRADAIEIVADIPVSKARQFMPVVQKLLRDDYVPVRFAAAVAVGDTKYAPAKNDVTQLLKDNDNNIRLAASYALNKLGDNSQAGQILTATKNKDQQVRANAVFLIGKLGDKKAIGLLYEAIKDDTSDDRVRLIGVEAIARLGDDKIYKRIWAMLISVYADDRVTGVRAMGALGNAQARDDLVRMLKDDLIEVRLVAAEQLGKLGDKDGEGVVIDALTREPEGADKEARERIRTLSALAISQIRTPGLKKYLPELIKNESQFVRLAAAKAVFSYSGNDNIGQ